MDSSEKNKYSLFENKRKKDLNRSNKIEQNRCKMNDIFEKEQNQLFIQMYKPG